MKRSLKILLLSLLSISLPIFALATTGTIDSTYKYAWAPNAGWINFAPKDNSNVYHGLTITDSAVRGTAWSDNFGWIYFNCADTPSHDCPQSYGVTNTAGGQLGGYAWNDNFGWINFSAVSIVNGRFTGTAVADNIGNIQFSPCIDTSVNPNVDRCIVNTDWSSSAPTLVSIAITHQPNVTIYHAGDSITPDTNGMTVTGTYNGIIDPEGDIGTFTAPITSGYTVSSIDTSSSAPTTQTVTVTYQTKTATFTVTVIPAATPIPSTTPNPGGGGGGGNILQLYGPNVPPGGFQILINNGSLGTNNPIVTLSFNAGQDVTKMKISSTPDFSGVSAQPYQTTTTFVLPAGDGNKTIYVKFINAAGVESSLISGSINLNTHPPVLTVVQQQNSFQKDQDVVISGTSNPNSSIIFTWDDQYGIIHADANGNWSANLGKMTSGSHPVTVVSEDAQGNLSKSYKINVSVGVVKPVNTPVPTTSPENPFETPTPTPVPASSTPVSATPSPTPQPVIAIPHSIPQVFQGSWNLLPVQAQR